MRPLPLAIVLRVPWWRRLLAWFGAVASRTCTECGAELRAGALDCWFCPMALTLQRSMISARAAQDAQRLEPQPPWSRDDVGLPPRAVDRPPPTAAPGDGDPSPR